MLNIFLNSLKCIIEIWKLDDQNRIKQTIILYIAGYSNNNSYITLK